MSHQAYVTTIRVGDASVTAINEGTALWAPELTAPEPELRKEMPEADAEGRIPINFLTVHAQIGERSIIIDPGFDDPIDGGESRDIPEWPRASRTAGLRAGLAQVGVSMEEVTDVLITHTHVDHFRGVIESSDSDSRPRFPRARIYVSRYDWDADPERADPQSDISVRLGELKRLGLLKLTDGDAEVAPGLHILHAPGESPGHSVVRITSQGQTLYVLGDLFHHRCEISHVEWKTPWSDGATLTVSRLRVLEDAFERNAVLTFTHDRFPPWFRLARFGAGYRAEQVPNVL
jgi:glyoxylase-like metal-dependent hydrolase (beta-lactamase superfamily II)